MAMQALAIVVGLIQLDGLCRLAQILDVHMLEAAQLGIEITIHGVIGVASEAGIFAWHKIVLEMHSGNKTLVVYVQAFSVIFHHMARQTELR